MNYLRIIMFGFLLVFTSEINSSPTHAPGTSSRGKLKWTEKAEIAICKATQAMINVVLCSKRGAADEHCKTIARAAGGQNPRCDEDVCLFEYIADDDQSGPKLTGVKRNGLRRFLHFRQKNYSPEIGKKCKRYVFSEDTGMIQDTI